MFHGRRRRRRIYYGGGGGRAITLSARSSDLFNTHCYFIRNFPRTDLIMNVLTTFQR